MQAEKMHNGPSCSIWWLDLDLIGRAVSKGELLNLRAKGKILQPGFLWLVFYQCVTVKRVVLVNINCML